MHFKLDTIIRNKYSAAGSAVSGNLKDNQYPTILNRQV